MSKKKIKLNKKYLNALGFDEEVLNEYPDNTCIKRISVNELEEDEEEGYVYGIINTPDVDADGDVVLPSSFDFKRFEKNPIVLFNHSMNSPIGYVETIEKSDSELRAKVRFGKTEEAQKIYELIKNKVLRTFSVSFITKEAYTRGSKEFNIALKALRNAYPHIFDNNNAEKVDRIIASSEMIELSIVSVPSNQEAVITEMKKLKVVEAPTVEAPTVKAKQIEEVCTKCNSNPCVCVIEEETVEAPAVEETVPAVEAPVIEETSQACLEEKKINIKIVGDTKKRIKVVSSLEEEKDKLMRKMYLDMWGC